MLYVCHMIAKFMQVICLPLTHNNLKYHEGYLYSKVLKKGDWQDLADASD